MIRDIVENTFIYNNQEIILVGFIIFYAIIVPFFITKLIDKKIFGIISSGIFFIPVIVTLLVFILYNNNVEHSVYFLSGLLLYPAGLVLGFIASIGGYGKRVFAILGLILNIIGALSVPFRIITSGTPT